MNDKETIPVFIKFEKGRTVCMCPRWDKRCDHDCEKEVVERDRYRGWQDTMRRDRYGRSRFNDD